MRAQHRKGAESLLKLAKRAELIAAGVQCPVKVFLGDISLQEDIPEGWICMQGSLLGR